MKNTDGKEVQLGRQLTTCEQVVKLAQRRKSVYHTGWRRQVPAAWMQNTPAVVLVTMLKGACIFEYIPKK